MSFPRLDETGLTELIYQLATRITNKVDKVTGKGLSTNDYTNDEKIKLSLTNTEFIGTKTQWSSVSDKTKYTVVILTDS